MLRHRSKQFEKMNVIPLIDVMLVLLAIVLITASFIITDKLNINLPETEQTQQYTPPVNTKVVHLRIDQHNQLFIDKTAVNLKQMQTKLAQLTKQQPLTLEVDKHADFGVFVALVDQIKKYQLTELTILTQPKSK